MRYFAYLLLLLPGFLVAQESNIFLGREYWKSDPSVDDIKAQIEAGNDPVAMNRYAFDAMVYGILEQAPLESLTYLLSLEGNSVNKITHDGRNYLLWAVYEGNLPLARLLIERGADTQLTDDYGYGMLTFAAVGGQQDPELYDFMLANGAEVGATNRVGANALHLLAPHLQDDKMLAYFLDKGLDLRATDREGNNIFFYATQRGNLPLMKQLVDRGVPPTVHNKQGGNAILFASRGARGYVNPLEVYEFLYELGIEADIVNFEGETPLHNIAYRTTDLDVFDFFLDKGVNVNQINKEGNTSFLQAIRGDNMVAARKLAPRVRAINHVNEEGYSALTYAVRRQSKVAFDFLLEQGADITVLDAEGNNLIYHAFDSYRPADRATFQYIFTRAKASDLEGVRAFTDGNTLAHLAIEKEAAFLLREAIEMGVDINQKNDQGLTPLHLAAMQASDETLLTLLLSEGADKTILTDFEESAFDLAAENEALQAQGTQLDFLKVQR